MISQGLAIIFFLVSIPFCVIFYITGLKLLSISVIPFAFIFLLSYALMVRKYHTLARSLMILNGTVALIFYTKTLGFDYGTQFIFIPFSFMPSLLFEDQTRRIKNGLTSLIVTAFYFLYLIEIPFGPSAWIFMPMTLVAFIMGISTISLFKFASIEFEKQLQASKQSEIDAKHRLFEAEKTSSMLSLMNQYQHDLKNPWASLIMASNRESITLEELKQVVRRQYKNAGNKLSVMLDILRGQHNRKEEAVNMNDILKNALDTFSITAFKVTFDFEESLPTIMGDRRDLEILFINLFKNSIEAMVKSTMKRQVTIRTSFCDEQNRMYVQITDTGVGMDKKMLKVFQ
ncbi:MAG: HAMP domain-containing histidine kinase, partial [Candidatus Margulisbacteria bacterium]|nr:HAMP domain-containing histidine kinase [Candidatus Margulisiibacteriota bacterium]